MPLYQKSKGESKVFCKVECEYIIVPEVIIKGGYKTKNGYKKYSESAIRDAFELKLKELLKK